MNRERLEHTAREVLPYVRPEKLRMRTWRCGTAACAFGHECLSAFGRANGLQLLFGDIYYPSFDGKSGYTAAQRYYDIERFDAEWLFAPWMYEKDPSPAEVAERIESLLASES